MVWEADLMRDCTGQHISMEYDDLKQARLA